MTVFQQMAHFTHASLLDEQKVNITHVDIDELCTMYGLPSEAVVGEITEFKYVYRSIQHMINVEDLIGSKRQSRISKECGNQLTTSTTSSSATNPNSPASDVESDDANAADCCGGTSIVQL